MEDILIEIQHRHLCSVLDIQFSRMVATPFEPALMLASVCLSNSVNNGHTCLPLELLTPENLFDNRCPILAQQAWQLSGSPSLLEWHELLLSSSAVSNGSYPTPLVLDNYNLYLQRMWHYECTVAKFFSKPQVPTGISEQKIYLLLKQLFPDENTNINWQKIAVAVSITHSVSLITGSSGTGKTFIIEKIIVALLMLSDHIRLRVIIATPTRKAAARLSQLLSMSLQHLELLEEKKQQFPREAITLHRLLGLHPYGQRTRYHHDNPIHLDVLIIDDASMIDLPMMGNLIMALPPQAKLILLGDVYKYPSIMPGAILSHIFKIFQEIGYSLERRKELKRLTGFTLPSASHNRCNDYSVADSVCLLHKNYYIKQRSNIFQLANKIQIGNAKNVLTLLKKGTESDNKYISIKKIKEYQNMINNCVDSYRIYLSKIKDHENPDIILSTFNKFRLVCVLREGPFGTRGLNRRIEQALSQSKLIMITNISPYYTGQPLILLESAPFLGLYSGDIGILLENSIREDQNVYFLQPDGKIKTVQLSCLPKHDTAFAMTVHQSQGMSFENIALVLPDQILPILTRELLYTAVILARIRLSIYSTDKILNYTIKTKTQRHSALFERLIARKV